MGAQEGASGSGAVETKLGQLLQNTMEESEEATENHDKRNKRKAGERFDAMKRDCQRALESLPQTEQTHTDEGSQSSSSTKRPKKSGLETKLYLESKAEKEFDLRKEELRIKKEEMGLQKELQLETKWKQLNYSNWKYG